MKKYILSLKRGVKNPPITWKYEISKMRGVQVQDLAKEELSLTILTTELVIKEIEAKYSKILVIKEVS